MRARIAHVVMIVVGLLTVLYPLTLATAPISCRGTTMRPGDVCRKADGSTQQTYAEREATRRGAVPVIIIVGAAVTAFGTSLLLADLRRRRPMTPAPRASAP